MKKYIERILFIIVGMISLIIIIFIYSLLKGSNIVETNCMMPANYNIEQIINDIEASGIEYQTCIEIKKKDHELFMRIMVENARKEKGDDTFKHGH